MTEALLAVENATDGQADFLRLAQEFLCEVRAGEVPPMLAALPSVGYGEQLCLVILGAQNAGSLNVDGDGTDGQRLNLLFVRVAGL